MRSLFFVCNAGRYITDIARLELSIGTTWGLFSVYRNDTGVVPYIYSVVCRNDMRVVPYK